MRQVLASWGQVHAEVVWIIPYRVSAGAVVRALDGSTLSDTVSKTESNLVIASSSRTRSLGCINLTSKPIKHANV